MASDFRRRTWRPEGWTGTRVAIWGVSGVACVHASFAVCSPRLNYGTGVTGQRYQTGSGSRYDADVLAGEWRRRGRPGVAVVEAEPDLVVEDAASGFCGAVVELGSDVAGPTVTLEDRNGRRRGVPLLPAAFLLDGAVTTLTRPVRAPAPAGRKVTASGSLAVEGHRARVALPSRIYVEGVHDAELVERVWGEDL